MKGVLSIVVLLLAAWMMQGCNSRKEVYEVGIFTPETNRFWEVVSRSSYVERIGISFDYSEGPAWHPGGFLLFSDIPADVIYRYTGKRFVPFRKPSNQANGLCVEPDGSLLVCEQNARRLTRVSVGGDVLVLADSYRGRRLNSPNDLCRAEDGTVYFTDPPYGLPLRNEDPEKEMPFNGIFRVRGDSITLIDSTLSWPNGIALSPDESSLYVANMEAIRVNGHEQNQMFWLKYSLDGNGKVTDKSIFYTAPDPTLPGSPDGMKVDRNGNLFLTGPGGILVVDPGGELLGTIELPLPPTNLVFGPREKYVYITASTTLYLMVINRT